MNGSGCKVSIITVSYNSVKTIEQTINSVLNQSYKNIEYIMIDGASTDGTQRIIEKYTDRIAYYISEKDGGLYYAMNKGLEKATGEIIGIINSDDWYADDAVENIVKMFSEDEMEAVYGKIALVSQDNKETVHQQVPAESIWYQMAFPHSSVFVKKGVYHKLGFFNVDYKLSADYELLLRFYSENVRFLYCDKVIAYFRLGGISQTQGEEGCMETYKIAMSYFDKCPCKESVLPKIKEPYEWMCFNRALQKNSGILHQLLCEYFHEGISEINIFGTGIWGKKCYKSLAGNGVGIAYFADNDDSKRDTELYGIQVISPDKLQDMDMPVLIAAREHCEEMKQQLDKSGKKVKYVTIRQLLTIYADQNNTSTPTDPLADKGRT